jgi:Sugar-specific transcriptional regulator TrmB
VTLQLRLKRGKIFNFVVTDRVTMEESIVVGLKKLGLTEYEARAYAALVGLGEATAREIHEASRVPRTRIYDILRDLGGKGKGHGAIQMAFLDSLV